MRYIYFFLLFLGTVIATEVYFGNVYYHKSQSVVSALLEYSPDTETVRINLLRPESNEIKIYTSNTSYYISFYTNTTSKSFPFKLNFNISSLTSTEVPRKLSTDDSRALSILFTGSWYNNEVVMVEKKYSIGSVYWNVILTPLLSY